MGFSVCTPSYMFQSPSGYIFRLRIPTDLRSLVDKGEFKYSLRTGSQGTAKHRASSIAFEIKRLFIEVRASMAEWSRDRINKVVRQYIKETLANDEKCRQMPRLSSGATQTLEGKSFLEASDMQANEARSLLTSVNRWLQNQDHSKGYRVSVKTIWT